MSGPSCVAGFSGKKKRRMCSSALERPTNRAEDVGHCGRIGRIRVSCGLHSRRGIIAVCLDLPGKFAKSVTIVSRSVAAIDSNACTFELQRKSGRSKESLRNHEGYFFDSTVTRCRRATVTRDRVLVALLHVTPNGGSNTLSGEKNCKIQVSGHWTPLHMPFMFHVLLLPGRFWRTKTRVFTLYLRL